MYDVGVKFELFMLNGKHQCSLCVDYVDISLANETFTVFYYVLSLSPRAPLSSLTPPNSPSRTFIPCFNNDNSKATTHKHSHIQLRENIKTFDRHFSTQCHNKIYFPAISLSPHSQSQHTKKLLHEQTLIFIYFIYMLIIIVEV